MYFKQLGSLDLYFYANIVWCFIDSFHKSSLDFDGYILLLLDNAYFLLHNWIYVTNFTFCLFLLKDTDNSSSTLLVFVRLRWELDCWPIRAVVPHRKMLCCAALFQCRLKSFIGNIPGGITPKVNTTSNNHLRVCNSHGECKTGRRLSARNEVGGRANCRRTRRKCIDKFRDGLLTKFRC